MSCCQGQGFYYNFQWHNDNEKLSPKYKILIKFCAIILIQISSSLSTLAQDQQLNHVPLAANCFVTNETQIIKSKLFGGKIYTGYHMNNSIQIWPLEINKISPQELATLQSVDHSLLPVGFWKICNGWKNLKLSSNNFDDTTAATTTTTNDTNQDMPPKNYWSLDVRKKALVAKYTIKSNQFGPTHLERYDTILISPIFDALPVSNKCTFSFAFYTSFPSVIEVNLLIEAKLKTPITTSSNDTQQYSNQLAFKRHILFAKQTVTNDIPRQQEIKWKTISENIPKNLMYIKRKFIIEINAWPTALFRERYSSRYKNLNGIAIANLSLSNSCFEEQNTTTTISEHYDKENKEIIKQEEIETKSIEEFLLKLDNNEPKEFYFNYDYDNELQINTNLVLNNKMFVVFIVCFGICILILIVALILTTKKIKTLRKFRRAPMQKLIKPPAYVELQINPNYYTNSDSQVFIKLKNLLTDYTIEHQNLIIKKSNKTDNNSNSNNLSTTNNEYKPLSLGRGAFGEVLLGELLPNHTAVAVKTLCEEKVSCDEEILTEALNMSQVDHENIVKFIGVCFSKPLSVVMELMAGGSLRDLLLDKRGFVIKAQNIIQFMDTVDFCDNYDYDFSYNQDKAHLIPGHIRQGICMGDLLVFCLHLASACDYLQQKKLIHRDLATRNCLLTSRERLAVALNRIERIEDVKINTNTNTNTSKKSKNKVYAKEETTISDQKKDNYDIYANGFLYSGMIAKLADFGLSRDIYSSQYYRVSSRELPVRWMPPESLDGTATSESDVWSFGVLMWEIFSLAQLPYQTIADNKKVIEYLRNRRRQYAKLKLEKVSSNNSDILRAVNEIYNKTNSKQLISDDIPRQIDLLDSSTNNNNNNNNNYNNNNNNNQFCSANLLNASKRSNSTANLLTITNNSYTASENLYNQGTIERQLELTNDTLSINDDNIDIDRYLLGPPLQIPDVETPNELYDVMCACWKSEPQKRPTFAWIAQQIRLLLQNNKVVNANLPNI